MAGKPQRPEVPEGARAIMEQMLKMPPKPHEEMKVGREPKADGIKSPPKRTTGKGRARVGKARS